MNMFDDLRTGITGEVCVDTECLEKASRDASLFHVVPACVVTPHNSSDVSAVVKIVSDRVARGETASVTVRSAGSDMAGGPLNDSVILDVRKHMARVVSVDSQKAVVEPGCLFRELDARAEALGVELPSFPASRDLASVGGMVANNSGGERHLKYGKTDRYVQSIRAVLADGNEYELKNFVGDELQSVLKEQTFRGTLCRGLRDMLVHSESVNTIEAAKPHVRKNSSGYALWEIGDGVTSLNPARLFTGAQGTLGIITQATVSLVPRKKTSTMVVLFVSDFAELGTLVKDVLQYDPDTFESFDDHTFSLGVKYFPEFAGKLKLNVFRLGLLFLPEVWMTLTGGVPKLVATVEFRGDEKSDTVRRAEACAKSIRVTHPRCRARVVSSDIEAQKYRVIRRESFQLLRTKLRGMRTAPFVDDFVVPPETLASFLPRLETILNRYDVMYTVAGHVGDGNFHIIPLIDPKRPDLARLVRNLSREVYGLVLEYHGSVTGEHNDGIVRTPYVEQMFGSDMTRLFEKVKILCDPHGIFNPRKKVFGTFENLERNLDVIK